MRASKAVPTQSLDAAAREWIAARLADCIAPPAIVDELIATGWHRLSAQAIVGRHCDPDASSCPVTPIPWPDLAQLPSSLDLGDRRADVLMFSRLPRTVLLGNFLADDECAGLIALAEPHLRRSRVFDANSDNGSSVLSYLRTSDTTYLRRGDSDLVERVVARVARATRWPDDRFESMQIVRYRPGSEFTPHYDYFDPASTGTAATLARSGQRVASMLLYLNTPMAGGTTLFPDAELEFVPRRGHALLFGYERPHRDTLSLHAGVPVAEGEKWVATLFMRDRTFIPGS